MSSAKPPDPAEQRPDLLSLVLTIFVTGSDTGIGKTRVAATIGRLLGQPGQRIQFIKPIETGRSSEEPGDADESARESGVEEPECFTFLRFPLPLAPVYAAQAAGRQLSLAILLEHWAKLPPCDIRIVEGAGGIAVPLDTSGNDWCAFARAIEADRIVLVTPDRLGGINQARLTHAYALASGLSSSGIWLNEVQPQSEGVRQSNREGIPRETIWAIQRFAAKQPENPEQTISFLHKFAS